MNLDEYLVKEGMTRADLSRKLGISKAAISKWEEIPEKWISVLTAEPLPERDIEDSVETAEFVQGRRIMARKWKIKGDKVHWLNRWWGRGSEFDFVQSASNIRQVQRLIRETGIDGAVQQMAKYGGIEKSTGEWIPAWPSEFVRDVKKNEVCPVIVDEIESRFKGGALTAYRTDPWKITTEVGDMFKPDEYFSR